MEKWTNEDAFRVLQSLSLAFHVGSLGDRGMREEQRREFYSIASDAEYDDFMEVKKHAEYLDPLFGGQGDSPERAFPDRIKESVQEARTGYRSALRSELERILSVAEPGDAERLEQMIGGRDAIKLLFPGLPAEPEAAVAQLLSVVVSPEFLEIAGKYASGPTAGHPRSICPTGLCRASNRLEYLRAYIACWTGYVRRARARLPAGTRIEVGFALPREIMEKLRARYPKAGIEAWRVPPSPLPPYEQRDECNWSLPLDAYAQLLSELSAQLIQNFRDISNLQLKTA
jgi:hypothetical protein